MFSTCCRIVHHTTPLPNIGAPATRAVAGIGITNLDDVRDTDLDAIARLHGVGPKAIRILRASMAQAPADTERLRFRPMTQDDLSAPASLLGDPAVMFFSAAPKSRNDIHRDNDTAGRGEGRHGANTECPRWRQRESPRCRDGTC